MTKSDKSSRKKEARKDIRDIQERLSKVEKGVNFSEAEGYVLTAFMHKHRLIPANIDFPGMLDSICDAINVGNHKRVEEICLKEINKDSVIKDLINSAEAGGDHPLKLLNLHSVHWDALTMILIQKGIFTEKEYQKEVDKASHRLKKQIEETLSDHSKQQAA